MAGHIIRRHTFAGIAAAAMGLGSLWNMTALASGEPARSAPVKGDRALGEYLSSECVTCHQPTGKYQGIPPIVGWPEASFVEIMKEYQHKKRANPVMQMIAGRLSEEEIAALAVYFGSLKSAH
jgi:cytochrome c